MNDYHIYSLYSGSSGNSTLFTNGDHSILIDAGRSAKALCNALISVGSDIRKIDAIFITHEHTDHISALEIISKNYSIPVHMTVGTSKAMRVGEYLADVLVTHPPLYECVVGNMKISSFATSHDCRCSVGYRIDFTDSGKSAGLVTDTGVITDTIREKLYGCESVVLECNHDKKMLICGPYPELLKDRILSDHGHLSNDDSAEFAKEICEHGTKNIMLAHLSEENNIPEYAYDTVCHAVDNENIRIVVASRSIPVMLN